MDSTAGHAMALFCLTPITPHQSQPHNTQHNNACKPRLHVANILEMSLLFCDKVSASEKKAQLPSALKKDRQLTVTDATVCLNHQRGLKIRGRSLEFPQIPAQEFLTRRQPSDSEFNQQKNTEAAAFALGSVLLLRLCARLLARSLGRSRSFPLLPLFFFFF